jgi:4-hydroxy-4-methyl-2-oxoglutarate aldolase
VSIFYKTIQTHEGKMTKGRLGRLPAEAIRHTGMTRVSGVVIDGLRALSDLTATVSDVLDGLGIVAVVPATELRPAVPGGRIVGQAITVRNVERRQTVTHAHAGGHNTMGDTEAYHLAEPGDVVVIEGIVGVSNMGGQGIQLAARQGCAGAVIDGSFRDPGMPTELGFPLWSRGATPITGKWRVETVEINGVVRIAGISVRAGDLVVGDDAGVCFVPLELAAEVLSKARVIDQGDAKRKRDIDAGLDIATLMTPNRYR